MYVVSCSPGKSQDEITPVLGNIEEIIVGKTWKLLDTDYGWVHLNTNNTYLTKEYLCDTLEQSGTWELDEKFQIPQVFSVGVEFTYIGKYLPQTLGKHYEVPWLTDHGADIGTKGTFKYDPEFDLDTNRPSIYDDPTHPFTEDIDRSVHDPASGYL